MIFTEMEELVDLVRAQCAKTLLDKVKVYEVQLAACTAQVKLKQAVEMGLAVLNSWESAFPKSKSGRY